MTLFGVGKLRFNISV